MPSSLGAKRVSVATVTPWISVWVAGSPPDQEPVDSGVETLVEAVAGQAAQGRS